MISNSGLPNDANSARENANSWNAPAGAGAWSVDLLGVLRRRWWLIAFFTVLGIGLAVLYSLTAQTVFESTGEILVIQKDARLPAQGLQAQSTLDQPESEELLATHIRILSSPLIVQRALEREQLDQLPSILEHLTPAKDAVDYVRENLTVSRGGEGAAQAAHVLRIGFRHTSAEDSAQILSALITSYQDFLGETIKGAGIEAVTLISDAKDELAAKLQREAEAYREFRENAPLLWNHGESQNVHQLRVAEWELALSRLRVRRTEVRSRLAIVSAVDQNRGREQFSDLERFALIDQNDIQRLALLVEVERGDPVSEAFQAAQPARAETASAKFDRLLALQLEERRLMVELGPQHPKVLELQEQIRQMQEFLESNEALLGDGQSVPPTSLDLNKLVRAYRELLQRDLEDLDRREHELQQLVEAERNKARQLISYELQEVNLSSELSRTQQLYDTVLARLREINLLKDYGGYITEVISPVQLGAPVWPHLPLLVALGTILGGFCGCGLALLVDLADRSFRSYDDVRQQLQLPILAHVPRIGWSAAERPQTSSIAEVITTYHDPLSVDAEAIRRLRTSLLFQMQGRKQKVIQVTSPLAGDGKTTVISNLAVSLAQTGKRVILVDCDMRRPQLHHLFGTESAPGLSDVLIEQVELNDAIQASDVEHLSLLACGTLPPNPAELIAMPSFGLLIERLREQFDVVLLDSPPVLAVSDPISIAGYADGVLLNLRLRKDTRHTAQRSRDVLQECGAHVLGLIINNSSLSQEGASRGDRYGYGYRYSYGYGTPYARDNGQVTEAAGRQDA